MIKENNVNKSKTYILPIIHYRYGIFDLKYVTNTYIYSTFDCYIPSFIIEYIIDDDTETNNFYTYLSNIKNEPYFDNYIYENNKHYIFYKLNDELNSVINKYIYGKYSLFSETDKYQIISFLRKYATKESLNTIGGVLYKTKSRRKVLEDMLGMKLDEDIELSSKPNLTNETLKLIAHE